LIDLHQAGQELPAGDAADAALQRAQVAVAAGFGPVRLAASPAAGRAEPSCPALHAVDAEHQVEDRARDGRQPSQADPARGRRHVTLAQQRVRGDERGERDVECEQRLRPDAEKVGPKVVHHDAATLPRHTALSKPRRCTARS